MRKLVRTALALWTIVVLISGGLSAACGQSAPKISVGSISGPLSNPIMWNILKANKFDAKHGFDLDIRLYPSIAAFYGGFSPGWGRVIIGGPTKLQKIRNEGSPLKIKIGRANG